MTADMKCYALTMPCGTPQSSLFDRLVCQNDPGQMKSCNLETLEELSQLLSSIHTIKLTVCLGALVYFSTKRNAESGETGNASTLLGN